MIALVSLAEAAAGASSASPRSPARSCRRGRRRLADVAPIVRGACSLPDSKNDGAWKRFVLDFRGGDAVMNFVNGAEVARYGQAGVVTPDHNIRIKNKPLVVAAPDDGDLAGFKDAVRDAVAAYGETYKDYFARNNARVGGIKTMLDPSPRVVLVPGVGLFGLGRSKKDATRRRRPRRGRDCHHHRCGGRRPLRAAAGSRSVRRRILVAGAGEAGRRQGTAAGGAGGRRSPARPAPSDSQRPRRSRRPAPKSRCSMSTRPLHRRRPRRSAARRSGSNATSPTPHRCAMHSRRSLAAFGGVDIVGIECRRRLAGPDRRGRRGGAARRASS